MNRALPWIVALLISLTANGVMTGIVLHRVAGSPTVSDVMGHPHLPPHRTRGGEGRNGGFNIRAFVRSLPEAQREEARQRFERERDAIRQLMVEARSAQHDAEAAMRADPYDPERAAQALDRLRASRFAIESAFEAIVLDLVADLPAEDRVHALEAGRRRPPPPHGNGGRRPPPRDPY
ncbi:periplasmic heavy metal sensor [Hyphobacterium sp. HN65]|uniref:Periplasmic heavy metal sensor n=1 Tax=Hyphobacterium lacteum TaxID=3116575 RepID=A0ABU7LT52_9PROT|nr:periplasmic heavy metal sensor [Hyphobacterium sp. HN65]MEE2527076.1 periplasmic heavy metal sensor [Hyphobacterium sp. HN65]